MLLKLPGIYEKINELMKAKEGLRKLSPGGLYDLA